ncbi:MAG TPA: hypothetical protein VGC79_02960 [Polyangiaceae bacterium]
MTHPVCQRLWQAEAARDGRLTGSELSNALRHRAECADCQQAARALDELGRKLKALPAPPAAQLVQKRTRQALLSAWNESLLAERRPKPRPRMLLIAAFSAIGGVALAVGYPLAHWGSRSFGARLVQPQTRPALEPKAREPLPAGPSSPAATLPQAPALSPELAQPMPGAPAPKGRITRAKREPPAAGAGLENAEDDAYLQIVNLLRTGREPEARAKATEYLQRFPHGFRRLEVENIAKQ